MFILRSQIVPPVLSPPWRVAQSQMDERCSLVCMARTKSPCPREEILPRAARGHLGQQSTLAYKSGGLRPKAGSQEVLNTIDKAGSLNHIL